MNQEIATKWVQALRSGKYRQAFNHLRKGDCFCALGVLCDIVNPQGWTKNGFGDWSYEGRATALTFDLAKRLDMAGTDVDGSFGNFHPAINTIAVAHLNDLQRLPFEAIADLVETHWETI